MEKYKMIKKLRELTKATHAFSVDIAINQAETAVIMNTFGISWDEIERPSDSFSLYYEMKRTEDDLKQEFEKMLKTLGLAKEKKLESIVHDTILMIKGFLRGVRFFNQELSDKFALMADKNYVSA